MNISFHKFVLFFGSIIFVAYFLYPSEFYLGQMYSKIPDRSISIRHFERFLSDNPHHKFATFHLSDVLESTADVDAAIKLMKKLYTHRKGDMLVADKIINLLENSGRLKEILYFRWQLYEDIQNNRSLPKSVKEELLYNVYQGSLLQQDEILEEKSLTALLQQARNPLAYFELLLNLQMEKNNLPVVQNLLEMNLKRAPKNADDWVMLSRVSLKQQQPTQALGSINKGLTHLPANPLLLGERIFINEQMGRVKRTIPDLEKMMAADPNNTSLKSHLAYNLFRIKAYKRAIPLYKELIALNPSDDTGWISLIDLLQKTNSNSEALAWTKKYIAQFPSKKSGYELLLSLYEKEKDINNQISTLKKLLTLFPNDLNATRTLAYLLTENGQFNEAEPLWRSLLDNNPNDINLAWELIYTYADKGRTAEAIRILENVIKLIPFDRESHEYLAYLYQKENQLDRIPPLWEAFLENSPDDRGAFFRLASSYITNKNWKKAEELYSRKLKKETKNAYLILKIAQLKSYQGHSSGAVDYYQQWIDLEGDDPVVYKQLGMEAWYAGHYETAKIALRKAQDDNPKDGKLYFIRSEVAAALGEKPLAKKFAKKALRYLPQKDTADMRKMRLHMRARIKWNHKVNGYYQSAVKQYPDRRDILENWIQHLIDNREMKKLPPVLESLQSKFPEAKTSTLRFKIQLAQLNRDWDQVIQTIERLEELEPLKMDLRRTLAEAHYQIGSWEKADKILNSFSLFDKSSYVVNQLKWTIRDRYYHHIGSSIRSISYTGQSLFESGLYYRGYFKEKMNMRFRLNRGFYDIDATGFHGSATWGQANLTYEKDPHSLFGLLLEASQGDTRNTVGPGVYFTKLFPFSLVLNGSYHYHRFWNDFPEAVAGGGVADETNLTMGLPLFTRSYLQLASRYFEYETGDKHNGTRTQFLPSLSTTLLNRPFVSLGYQFTYDDVNNNPLFLAQIPLLRKTRTHYLLSHVNYELKNQRVGFAADFFNGHDDERGLKFFEGDLFGLSLHAFWRPTPTLRFEPHYEFSRESLAGISGENHTATLKMEVQWRGYEEKNNVN